MFLVIIAGMEAFFPDLDIERLPPESVRVVEMTAEPLPDGRRIHILLKLTPFLKSPLIELSLTDPEGEYCGGASIVEPAGWNLELTLHIRTGDPKAGRYVLSVVVSYPDKGEIDNRNVEIDIPAEITT